VPVVHEHFVQKRLGGDEDFSEEKSHEPTTATLASAIAFPASSRLPLQRLALPRAVSLLQRQPARNQ